MQSTVLTQPIVLPETPRPSVNQWSHLATPPLGEAWPKGGFVPVSVLIPVKNEQANLAQCIRLLRWADQIVVVDSQSSDETVPIAQAMGAEVYQFHYSRAGWPKKKNWALQNIPWRNEWVL